MNFNGAIIQARLGSKRLPNKILKPIYKKLNSLDLIFLRLKKSKLLDKIIFAIPKDDKLLIDYLESKGYPYVWGSENNLVSRYLKAAEQFNIQKIIRITSDCPLIDSELLDKCILNSKHYEYFSNNTPPEESDFANGSDIEIFNIDILKNIEKLFNNKKDREHVTFPMWDGRMQILSNRLKKEKSDKGVRITLDYPEDLKVIRIILEKSKDIYISYDSIIRLYRDLNLELINGKFHYSDGWK